MGIDVLKFVMPPEVLKMNTELNLGFCKEAQRGVKLRFETYTVPWDDCTKRLSSDISDPETIYLDISECKKHKAYDWSHDCLDGTLDISKCMEGMEPKVFLSISNKDYLISI